MRWSPGLRAGCSRVNQDDAARVRVMERARGAGLNRLHSFSRGDGAIAAFRDVASAVNVGRARSLKSITQG